MKDCQYPDLIKLCISIWLLMLASVLAWTGMDTSTATTLDPATALSSPASKRGRIVREAASQSRIEPVDPHFLDYEMGSTRALKAGNDMT